MSTPTPALIIVEISLTEPLRIVDEPILLTAKAMTPGHTVRVFRGGSALNRDRSISTFLNLTITSFPPSPSNAKPKEKP